MKQVMYVLAVVMFLAIAAGPTLGQTNPFLGTWKLNVAKSRFEGAPGPKNITRTVSADRSGAKYAFEGESADGSKVSYSFTTQYDGKDVTVSGTGMPGGADAITLKRTGSTSEGVLKKGGKEIGNATSEVSKDGKTTTVKTALKTADGKVLKAEQVYEKQ